MMNGVMVVGLVSGEHTIEDIRVSVPYQVAVTIPANLVMRSRDLAESIQQKKVLKLSGSLPSGTVMRGGAPVRRSGAANPAPPVRATNGTPAADPSLKAENARLAQELEDAKTRERNLHTMMGAMSGQLTAIQGVLEELKKQGIHVSTVPVGPSHSEVDGTAPMFITSVKKEDAKVHIKVTEQEASTDIAASRAALKNLRKKQE